MKIDLTTIKKVCISLQSSQQRRENFINVMNKLGYINWTFFDGITNSNPVIGCALSQIAVLRSNLDDEPLLIFEDDIKDSQWHTQILEIPDKIKADAIYIGYSSWPCDVNRAHMSNLDNCCSFERIENFYKIKNMTSAHAIIYLTKEYKESCANEAEKYLSDLNGIKHCDVVYAKLQHKYNVFATPKHYFYQNCPHNKFWTEYSIF